MYLRNCGLPKTWLDKCLKIHASYDPLTSNVVNGTKHCRNLNNSTFNIFIDHCEGKCVQRISHSDMQSLRTVC